MGLQAPNEKQARIIWFSLTTLAIAVIIVLLGLICWGAGIVINNLSSVLIPIALAAIIACILDPAVDFFELKLKIPRLRAILLVFFIAIMFVLILLATVVPQIVYESQQLIDSLPSNAQKLQNKIGDWLVHSPTGIKIKDLWDKEYGVKVQEWLTTALPEISTWLLSQLLKAVSWFGLLAGFALVPIYTFYFLLEKKGIRNNWQKYIPTSDPVIRNEIIFIVHSINDCLVAFFRGQILISFCTGTMLAIGYLIIGLKYAVLLGVIAAIIGIIPYLGAITSLILALSIALIQFQDWYHPLFVIFVYILAQTTEGWIISPKIIGDRIGLHPLTTIIVLMVGTALMGGIIGGILAIPIIAILRSLLFRYVWKNSAPSSAT
ncbi:MAG TPA: AI-2E family transporter [Verrucomicrobiota bacterium]|nr:AI-2E family transporter [Verrucomicrobiota bacterium]